MLAFGPRSGRCWSPPRAVTSRTTAPGPEGPLKGKVPPEAGLAKIIGERFQSALSARPQSSIAAVAAEAEVPAVVVQEFADGRRWPDLSTVSRLERALGIMLWVRGTSSN